MSDLFRNHIVGFPRRRLIYEVSKLHHEIACLLCCDQVSLKLGCTDNILKLHILEIEVYVLCVSNFIEGLSDEPHREKTGFLPRRKQRRRSASR